jgi:uncharacterized membrane protein
MLPTDSTFLWLDKEDQTAFLTLLVMLVVFFLTLLLGWVDYRYQQYKKRKRSREIEEQQQARKAMIKRMLKQ